MIDFQISNEALLAIKSKKEMCFRIKTHYDIMDRIINPIGIATDKSGIILYSHYKKTYVGAAKDGIQVWTVCESKEMPSISTIDRSIYTLIETLEKMGYKLYTKK